MKINRNSGLPLQIYIPNSQKIQPFEFEFYTNPSTSKTTNICASYDGTTFTNCRPWNKGVYLYSEIKFPNDGELLCKATYKIPNTETADGMQKIVLDNIPTDIEIVSKGGDYFDTLPNPELLEIPSFNDKTCNHLPIFLTFYPTPYIKSKLDKSKLSEQEIEGEFFIGSNGVRKQVYGKRISIKGTLEASGNIGSIRLSRLINQIDTLVGISGYVIIPYMGGDALLNDRIMYHINSGSTQSIDYNSMIYVYNDNLNLKLEVNKTEAIGKDISIDFFITYTKK